MKFLHFILLLLLLNSTNPLISSWNNSWNNSSNNKNNNNNNNNDESSGSDSDSESDSSSDSDSDNNNSSGNNGNGNNEDNGNGDNDSVNNGNGGPTPENTQRIPGSLKISNIPSNFPGKNKNVINSGGNFSSAPPSNLTMNDPNKFSGKLDGALVGITPGNATTRNILRNPDPFLPTKSCISQSCSPISICSTARNLGHHLFGITDIRNKTKELCKAGCWELGKGGFYNPISTAESSPMIKITGSHIELNFAGNFIENTDTSLAGWIGIEVGYSPAELAANTSLRQPKDIVISNVHLRNFDCGILIHKGVERIVIQESVILDSSLGIVILGDPDSHPTTIGSQMNVELVKSISIVNCKIIGHGLNRRDALVNLKTRIEGADPNYAYTTDLFMPLRGDRLNANLVDVYTYSGILATHTKNFLISCVDIECTGNRDFASEADTTRTEGIGIILRDVDLVTIQHTKTHETYGTVKATGLQLERVCGIDIYDSDFSYANSSYFASGIETFPDFLAKTFDGLLSGFDYTVEEFDMCEVKTEFQRSAVFSAGIFLTDTRGLNGENVAADRNIATSAAFGLLTFTSVDISFTDSTFDRNIAGAATTTLKSRLFKSLLPSPEHITRTTPGSPFDGVCAIGAQINTTNNIKCKNITCSNNLGENSGRGIQLTTCSNCIFEDSNFSYNQATAKRLTEDSDIRTAQDANIISKQGPTVDPTITGAYGCIVEVNSSKITWSNCKAEHNSAHRSAGFLIKDSTRTTFDGCSASYQEANGDFLSSDITAFTPTTASFLAVHQPLFASDACDVDPTITNVNYTNLHSDFLTSAESIRETQAASNTVNFSDEEPFVAAIALATASIARFRLWGTANGIHIHNGQHFVIKNSACIGQTSLKDNAMGVLISGRSSDFEVVNCNLSYNEAWTDSAQTLYGSSPDPDDPLLRYEYDLSCMRDYWLSTVEATGGTLTTATANNVLSLAYNHNGGTLAAGYLDVGGNTNLQIWEGPTLTSEQIITSLTDDVNSVDFSPDDTMLAAGSDDNSVEIFDTSDWSIIQTLNPGGGNVNALAWSPDGTELAVGGDNDDVIIYNTTTWAINQTLSDHGRNVNTVAWSPDGTLLASGSDDEEIFVYNTSTWAIEQNLTNHSGDVRSVRFSPDSSMLASGAEDNDIIIFNTSTWAVISTLSSHTGNVNTVAWKPDGTQLASGSDDNTVIIWDATSFPTIVQTIAQGVDTNALAWSPNGLHLATGRDDDTITIYETSGWTVATAETGINNFDTSGSDFIASGEQGFGSTTINETAPYLIVNGVTHSLIPPAAPTATGLYMSDLVTSGYVAINLMNSNFGHSGHGFGIACTPAYSITVVDNNVFNNGSNIYGVGTGILDIASYSPNIYLRNFFSNNKVKAYVNANDHIPMKDGTFQVDEIENGNYNRDSRTLHNLALQLPIDPDACTVESSFDKSLQSLIIDRWQAGNWIS